MLSVEVHKDVAEYQPKIIGKLTARTLIALSGALGLSVLSGLYIYFILGLDVSTNSWIIYMASLPFWVIGFYKPKGMNFEEWLPCYLRHHLSDNRLFYEPSAMLIGMMPKEEAIKKRRSKNKNGYKKFRKQRGIEAYSPRTGTVSK